MRLEARREQPDLPAVSIRELLRQTLRLRPDRIILGEVRGAEAFDLLQALNTGHQGTLSTIHANTAELALSRFHTCISMAGINQSERAISRNIAEVVNVLVHIERRQGKRIVTQVLQIDGYEPELHRYRFTNLLKADQREAELQSSGVKALRGEPAARRPAVGRRKLGGRRLARATNRKAL